MFLKWFGDKQCSVKLERVCSYWMRCLWANIKPQKLQHKVRLTADPAELLASKQMSLQMMIESKGHFISLLSLLPFSVGRTKTQGKDASEENMEASRGTEMYSVCFSFLGHKAPHGDLKQVRWPLSTNWRAEWRKALNSKIKYSIRHTHTSAVCFYVRASRFCTHIIFRDVTLMAHYCAVWWYGALLTQTLFPLSLQLFPSSCFSLCHPSLQLCIYLISFTLNLFKAAVHPLLGVFHTQPRPPHNVVVSVYGCPISGPTEVSRVADHGAAQAAPWIPRAIWRPSGNHLR